MLLIRNGLFFDGTGSPGVVRDVVVADGHVREVAAPGVDPTGFDRVIDADGAWVMPGFVDTHTHYDAEVLASPGLVESVRHGVTTVVMGSCSLSTMLASNEDCADIFSRVEALPREHVIGALEATRTWSTPGEWLDALEQLPLGPNVAAFLGHSDLRAHVMGLGRSVDPDVRPTEAELAQMEQHLEDALDAGLLGLSTMTNPWDKVGGDRYRSAKLPSTYATWGEYRRLHRVLRRRERILQSAPNITTKVNMVLFVAESCGFGLRKPLKTTLITASDPKSNPMIADLATTLATISNAALGANMRWQTIPMPFEVYADGMDLVVFEEFGAGEAALHLADELERNELLRDEAYRRRFRKDYESKFSPRVWHRDFYDATIVDAPDAAIVGQTFGEVADARGLHPVDAFLDLVVEHGAALRWKTTIANHRPEKIAKISTRDCVQISFSDAGAHVRNMAFYNFPLYALRTVRDAAERGEPLMPLEHAVHKLTGELAEWHGLDAGRLHVGDRADIAIIDPAGLNADIDAYAEAPMDAMGGLMRMVRRNDDAVRATIIAGEVVYEGGRFAEGYGTTMRTGSTLRAGQKAPAPTTSVSTAQAAE